MFFFVFLIKVKMIEKHTNKEIPHPGVLNWAMVLWIKVTLEASFLKGKRGPFWRKQ